MGAASYTVVSPCAVAALAEGGERYLYRGAVIAAAEYTEESLAHLLGIGLIAAAPVELSGNPGESEPATVGGGPKTPQEPPETPEEGAKAAKKK